MSLSPRRALALALLLSPGCGGDRAAPPPEAASGGKVWMGVSGLAPESQVPALGSRRFKTGLRIARVVWDGPAEKAGLKADDLLVEADGVDFSGDPEGLPKRLRDAILAHRPGARMRVAVLRDWVDQKAEVGGQALASREAWADMAPAKVLEKRPEGTRYRLSATRRRELIRLMVTLDVMPAGRTLPSDEAIFPEPGPAWEGEAFARTLVEKAGWTADTEDLLKRLTTAATEAPDAWRLPRMAYALRNPFRVPQVSRRLLEEVATARIPLDERVRRAALWLDRPFEDLDGPLQGGEDPLDEIEAVLGRARTHLDLAFARLSAADLDFLAARLDKVLEKRTGDILPDRKVVALAERVDFPELFRAAAILARFVEGVPGAFESRLAAALEASGRKMLVRETAFGRIVIAGPGRDWHKQEAAILIDLGGDDFYTSLAGGASGPGRPVSVLVDLGGDDAYESSVGWSQGCARLGVGILADFGGDDAYLAQDWGQGTAALGVGILLDAGGDDTYRGGDLVQGTALWGIGMLIDQGGVDERHATCLAQGCGLPGGLGALLDDDGDDAYFCKGRHPTGYGNPGLFDGLSQGCGMGLRDIPASGGIGILLDRAGNDRYEAGHFSQGGGYYFGWGLLQDAGGDDSYMGSRYAQGFAAHQAVGFFEDAGGNDRYGTRHGVAQGCAWDESVAVFLDDGGDDVYDGGWAPFSQGASAQNGLCLFLDSGGDDIYRRWLPDRSGPNEYHGGSSLSVAVDAGGGRDRYVKDDLEEALPQDQILLSGVHGAFADLPGLLEEADLDALLMSLP